LFETAARVFDDPAGVSYVERVVDLQERWHTIGLLSGIVFLLVAHTVEEGNDEEEVRIISARKASRSERAIYESVD
jgi:uncharacterized DUF497 family protein